MEEDSIASLEQQIAEYTENKNTLETALKVDKDNEELKALLEETKQVINMTKEVLQLKRQEEQKKQVEDKSNEISHNSTKSISQNTSYTMKYPKGHVCRAKWSQDGNWYDAIIESVDHVNGTYLVLFTGYGNKDRVKEEHISPPTAPSLQPEQDLTPIAIPDALKINKEDTSDVKAAKKKKIHSIKSKNRFKQMDAMTNSKKNEWKNFMQTANKKKRGMPFSRKESMFRSPDTVDGKVGVVGSGKGMTTFNDTRKVDPRRKKVELSLEQPKRH